MWARVGLGSSSSSSIACQQRCQAMSPLEKEESKFRAGHCAIILPQFLPPGTVLFLRSRNEFAPHHSLLYLRMKPFQKNALKSQSPGQEDSGGSQRGEQSLAQPLTWNIAATRPLL